MAWIEPADIVAVFPTDASTEGLIAHVQALAEVVIGEQTEPVTSQLAAVMVQITHRFYLATDADGNIVQETLVKGRPRPQGKPVPIRSLAGGWRSR